MRLHANTLAPSRLALCVAVAALLAGPSTLAATFDITPGGLNRVAFENDAPFETVTGISNGVGGSLSVDLSDLSKTTGKVVVPVKSIKTGITKRDEHLASDAWLDAGAHPELTFEITRADLPAGGLADGQSVKGKVTGKLTIKGKTKTVTAAVKISFHKATEKTRKAWIKNDVLRVKGLFKINIRDFGVNPPDNIAGVKVADEVEIKVNLTPMLK